MLYDHFSQVPLSEWRWGNFAPDENGLACACCGEFYLDTHAMDCLQHTRDILGKPLRITSGHRCALHNARVGGAPLSQHRLIAFDISLKGHKRHDVYLAAKQAGFTSFGFYETFLHADTRIGRRWYGSKKARRLWSF